ncbi:MAG: thiamine-phosphate kinase [Candidatus Methylopumilus sp.]|jgi:thiamine-monophosphate kinase|nr:thiamine-phosphate kinase [Candidatus Methylopumilus sp.]
MPTEFNIIEKYFTRPSKNADLGVGDDAALIQICTGHQLAVSADMLVAGTHFLANCPAYFVGWKSLAVNISDMAAMGATPKWATLAIGLPKIDEDWLAEFSRGFFACADAFGVSLIGGDTTRGPLNISVQIMGEVPIGKALRRDGAKVGDEVWVSGILGAAALGLAQLKNILPENTLSAEEKQTCINALQAPQPRVALGLALQDIAHSAIDISDGLLADLGHIVERSTLGANLYWEHVPHVHVSNGIDTSRLQNLCLAGGDDYELCFTAPASQHNAIVAIGKKLNLKLSAIGETTQKTNLNLYDKNHQLVKLKTSGYDHFS